MNAPRASFSGWPHIVRWGAAAALLAHFFAFPFRELPLATDVRHYVYFAKLTTMGGTLYRDVFEVKTPLSTLAGAFFLDAGQRLGAGDILAIRVGYLSLAALVGLLAFRIHLHLGRGNLLAAHLALAPCLGFWLLGGLPAIGNVPKLLMALSASAAALCVQRRAFLLAGLAAAGAWLDWQVGALVAAGIAVGVAALPRSQRGRAWRQGLAGLLIGTAPVLMWLWSRGALGAAVGQTLVGSAFRGAAAWQGRGLAAELARRTELVASACPGEWWLLLAAAFGLLVGPRRLRDTDPVMARTLATYHYGIVAFSVLELQGLGDLFALLHSAAFFAGLALSELPLRLSGAVPAVRRAAAVLSLVLVLAAARPWVSRSGWRPPPAVPATGASLPEQRRLASGLRQQLEGRTVSILGPSDQRVLTDRLDAGRLVVWTPATYRYYRSGAGESSEETLARLLLEGSPELVVCDLGYDLERATGGRFRVARDHVVQERGVTLFAPYLPVPP